MTAEGLAPSDGGCSERVYVLWTARLYYGPLFLVMTLIVYSQMVIDSGYPIMNAIMVLMFIVSALTTYRIFTGFVLRVSDSGFQLRSYLKTHVYSWDDVEEVFLFPTVGAIPILRWWRMVVRLVDGRLVSPSEVSSLRRNSKLAKAVADMNVRLETHRSPNDNDRADDDDAS